MKFHLSKDLECDLDRLVYTKLLVQSNSGGGKSRTIRRILEQTAGKIQHLVTDPEGEFATLRERHDYLLVAGEGGDVVASPRTARHLAERLLELHASAILDIFELSPRDRILFVKEFFEGLVDAPKKLWHPAIVVLDEAHLFCPETGSAESADAVKALASKGRKRGFCTVLATQRLSKLHKDTAAECNNRLFGRTGLDVDLKRACDDLGFGKGDWHRLRDLEPGQFFAYGPALCQSPRLTTMGPVFTTHPEAGDKLQAAPAPPPTEKVKALLQKLSDLPKEVEQKRKTEEDLRKEVADLRRKLLEKVPPPTEVWEKEVVGPAARADLESFAKKLVAHGEAMERLGRDCIAALDRVARARPLQSQHIPTKPVRPLPQPTAKTPSQKATNDGTLTGPEQKILDALLWLEGLGISPAENVSVAGVAGYTVDGGGYLNPRGHLKALGLVAYENSRVVLTEEGRRLARDPGLPRTNEALQERVLGRLSGPEKKILEAILKFWPNSVTNEEVAAITEYAVDGGGYLNPRGRLRSLGLIEYPERGYVRARDVLFPEGVQ